MQFCNFFHVSQISNSAHDPSPPILGREGVYLSPANEVCEGCVFTNVCLSTGGGGACVAGGHAWLGWACEAWLACMAVGCALPRHVWQVACVARGHAWLEACMAWGMHGQWGMCGGGVRGRRDGHCSGRYAFHWNASFLKKTSGPDQNTLFCGILTTFFLH